MERMQANDQNQGSPADAKLNDLLAAYRAACPDPEFSSPDFMPNLWSKIEAKRVDTTSVSVFRHLAQACMVATLALLILSTVLMPPPPDEEVLISSTYTDVIAADHADAAYVETLPADLPGVGR
jgi:hypothetical protein